MTKRKRNINNDLAALSSYDTCANSWGNRFKVEGRMQVE